VNLLLDVLEGIYNLVQAARQMPDHFLGQMSEELLGMDLTAPMPFERSAPPDTKQAAQAALEGGAIDHADARVATQSSVAPEQIQLDQPPPVEELDPALLDQFGPVEGKEVEFGERTGPEFGLGAAQADAIGAGPATGGPAATNETPAAAPAETQEQRAERELQEFMKQETPSGCEKPATEEPAGPGQIPEAMKIGPLSAGQRGRYLLHQMVKGIKEWFACNWGKLLVAAVGVLLGAILLNVLTGGAIMAALPLIMQVVSAFMLAQTVVRVTSYFGDYLGEGWAARLAAAGKALARGLAIAAVEIVFALLFNLGSVIKALKGGLKGAASAAAKAAKATIVSGVKAVGSLAKLGVQAGKTALKNGRLILAGLRSGIARGARSIKDFASRLWKAVRFKKFKIVFTRGWFKLLAWVNPWIVVMEGKLKGTLQEVDDVQAAGKQIGKDVKASTFKTVEGKTVKGKLVSATDEIPTDYRKTMEIFLGKNIDKYVVHHMIEQQTRKLTKLVDDILLHSPVNLKLIPKGQINSVVHLSRIRRMWNLLYEGIGHLPGKGKLAALRHFEEYTDEFITEMLKFAEKRGTKLTRAALEAKAAPWVEVGKLSSMVDEAVEAGEAVAKAANAVK
jgi:hypothetical protein